MKGWMPREWSMEIDYLLDRMDEKARAEFQARILEDHEAFAKVAEVENELFDAYASGSLPGDLRAGFEKTLLRQPGAKQKLTLARRLAGRSKTRRSGGGRTWLAVAAGVVAIIAGSFYTGRDKPSVLVLRLPAIERGADRTPVYDIRPGEPRVDLVVAAPAGTSSTEFAAVLTAKDAEVAQWSGVTPRGGELRFQVEAAKLPEGAYLLTVRDSAGPVSFHEFRVRASR